LRRRTSLALLCLGAWLAFLAFGGLSHTEYIRLAADVREGRIRLPADIVRLLRAYPADDGDVRRSFSYAKAMLGRPYLSFYIRSAEAWERAFAADEDFKPDEWPLVTPPRALVPWRDFLVEYPPGYFLAALPPALFTSNPDTYRGLYVVEMGLCLLGALYVCERLRRRLVPRGPSILVWGAAAMPLLGLVCVSRTDALVALVIAIMLWAALRARPMAGGVAAALAVATKGVPALIVPVLIALDLRRRRYATALLYCATAAIAFAAIVAAWVAWAGTGILAAVRYHLERPLEVETTAAAVVGLLQQGQVHPIFTYGSVGVTGGWSAAAGSASTALLAVSLVITFVAVLRNPSPERTIAGTVLVLVLFMVLGRVFSAQFVDWILGPALLAGALAGRRALVALLVVCAISQIVYPGAHERLRLLDPRACALVLVRNLALATWSIAVFHRIAPARLHGASDPEAASGTIERGTVPQ
jgi:hypothetical protein